MKFFYCPCQQDSTKRRLIIKSMSTTTNNHIAHVSRNWTRDSPNSYQKKQRLTMLMDMKRGTETPLTHVKRNLILLCLQYVNRDSPYPCQEKPNSNLPMSTEILLTHVKRNLTLLCPCQQSFSFPMSRETSLCSAHVKHTLSFLMSREILFCPVHFNRDSLYPCQEKPHSALPVSSETPLTHVKKNLKLLCPCHQRLPLHMSRETLLCSAHVIRDSPYPCQEKPYSALPTHVNIDLPCPWQDEPHSELAGSTETPLTHVKRNFILLCLHYVNRDFPYPCQEKPHSALSIVCKQRFPLSISRETSFCSVYSMSTEIPLTHIKRNFILLCLQYVNRDSPYPYQEKLHSALSTVCQQRFPLPISRETSF
jgi:hypothetical protein